MAPWPIEAEPLAYRQSTEISGLGRKESKACTPVSDSHRVKGLEICSCHFPLTEGSSAPCLPWQCTPLSNCTKVKTGTRDLTELERRQHQQSAGEGGVGPPSLLCEGLWGRHPSSARGCRAAICPLRSGLCLQACSPLTFTSKSTLFLDSSLGLQGTVSPHIRPLHSSLLQST